MTKDGFRISIFGPEKGEMVLKDSGAPEWKECGLNPLNCVYKRRRGFWGVVPNCCGNMEAPIAGDIRPRYVRCGEKRR